MSDVETDPLESIPKEEVQKSSSSTFTTNTWNRSVGVMSRKNLSGLVKIKKPATETGEKNEVPKTDTNIDEQEKSCNDVVTNRVPDIKNIVPSPETSNGLSLLGAYSGSDSNDSE